MDSFRELGAQIVGVSRDSVRAQARFADGNDLGYPLLSDRDGQVALAYGVRMPLVRIAARVTFLIDEAGTIERVYDRVSPQSHAGDVVDDLRRRSPRTDSN